MKIQELAIIFIIIILPISLVISEYTQFQIQTISLQTEYDTKLTVATYDAIKAFQLNTQNESYSDMTNQKLSDLTASINAFRNSLRASFKLNGYTEEELDNYIPALVYTLYDGFYIYSPYENIVDSNGEILEDKSQRESLYGIKPYINYSCRYIASGIDVVITYALDNYINVRGQINGEYVNKSGYLIDEITVEESTGKVTYNNQIQITTEQLREYLPIPKAETGTIPESYPYIKINGTKYYKVDLKLDVEGDDSIIALKNGVYSLQCQKKNIPEGEELDQGTKDYESYSAFIDNNNQAIQYYKAAAQFTKWVRDKLENLKYKDAVNEDGDSIWEGNTTPIFKKDELNKIENDLSNFNQHRLAIIRNKIETNLAIAISNYNNYSGAATNNVFLMPELKENEWDYIIHNISLISFMQGLPIGGKIYNGYSIVTNSESEEVVLEENIYILGSDRNYHKIGDKGFANKEKEINAGNYGNSNSAGRINQDFNRAYIINDDDTSYYYPLQQYNASYDSIVMQNNITTYEDLYKYVDSQTQNNPDLVKAFYTALGRERVSKYNSNFVLDVDFLQGEKYIIEYKANADNVTNLPTTQVKIEGIDTNIAPEIPERGDQYRFKGWSTSQTALEVEYESGDTYTDDAPLTLYAVWESKIKAAKIGDM